MEPDNIARHIEQRSAKSDPHVGVSLADIDVVLLYASICEAWYYAEEQSRLLLAPMDD